MSCVNLPVDSCRLGLSSDPKYATVQSERLAHDVYATSGFVADATLYSPSAFPNVPSGLNLFYLIPDMVRSIIYFYRACKQGDSEGAFDVTMHLIGIPVNAISSSGTIVECIKYLIHWNVVAPIALLLLLAPFIFCFGILLCLIEIIIDIVNLVRVRRFYCQFNFAFLSQLKLLLTAVNSKEGLPAVREVSKLLKKDPEKFQSIFGQDEYQKIEQAFADMERDLEANPSNAVASLRSKSDIIQSTAISLMLHDLCKLRDEYLELTQEEKEVIRVKIGKQFGAHNGAQLIQRKLEEACFKACVVKKKGLARRVRPRMLHSIDAQTPYLIGEFEKTNFSALDRGFLLFNNMKIQTEKITIVLVLDIMALTTTIGVFVLALLGSLWAPFIALMVVSMVICILRFVVCRTVLDEFGWKVSVWRLLPSCISNRIFSPDNASSCDEGMR